MAVFAQATALSIGAAPDANADGAADDAELLGGQNSAHHLARANHTGTQLASTISDFDAAVGGAAIERIAGSTYSTVQHMQDIFHSAGSSEAPGTVASVLQSLLQAEPGVQITTSSDNRSIIAVATPEGVCAAESMPQALPKVYPDRWVWSRDRSCRPPGFFHDHRPWHGRSWQ